MDRREELPQPTLCGFNIRQWTLAVACLNSVVWLFAVSISIYFSCFKTTTHWKEMWYSITMLLYLGFIQLNVILRTGVLVRKIFPMVLWLFFYVILWFAMILFILSLLNVIDDRSYGFLSRKGENPNIEILILFMLLILEVFWAFSIYIVYQNLTFEMKLFRVPNGLEDAESFTLAQQDEEYDMPK